VSKSATPASQAFRDSLQRAVDLAVEHLDGLADRPVFEPMTPAERSALMDQPLPEMGLAPDAILDLVRDRILAHPMGNGHPRFFGWINSAPAPMGIIGELIASAMDPSCAGGDHAAIYLERCCVRWLMELVGFPTQGSMGLLVSGGSMASLTCLAAARHWAAATDGWNVREEGMQSGRPQLVAYVSSEGHSCLRKAGQLLGLGTAGTRVIPVNERFEMDVPSLRAAIAADRALGRRPFCVAASAGTAGTGAIDPLDELCDLCESEKLWMHFDGAYGAIAAVDPECKPRLAALNRGHSLGLDPHKWLSVPYECGCALVRDGAVLRDAFSLVPPYLRTEEGKGIGGLPWFAEYGFQQTREFRALKLWMTLLAAGRSGIAETVSRHRALARHMASLIDQSPELERMADVPLSAVCFRYVPPSSSGDEELLDQLNKRVMESVQSGGKAFLTSTQINGRFALRACVLHYATTKGDVAALVDVVRQAGKEVVERMKAEGGRMKAEG
jgi:aromatic-L-amino-acid/L-tryptophan decarboxylase